MLRNRGIAQLQQFRQLADRTLTVDQLTDDEKPVTAGKRLQEIAGLIGSTLHRLAIYFHSCVYTKY